MDEKEWGFGWKSNGKILLYPVKYIIERNKNVGASTAQFQSIKQENIYGRE